jgi:hypothetical protein
MIKALRRWFNPDYIDWWAVITTLDDLSRAAEDKGFTNEVLAEHTHIERKLIVALDRYITRRIKDVTA